jgi:hypothetical protein
MLACSGAALAVLLGGSPASAHGTGSAGQLAEGPYCPERAPFGGKYVFSLTGSDGHHYDVYTGLPFSPFGQEIIDCGV